MAPGNIGTCALTCKGLECNARNGSCSDWCNVCTKNGANYTCNNSTGSPICPVSSPDTICDGTNGYIKNTYAVGIDDSTGDVSGYAWNPYVGWISFERTTAGNPPGNPYIGGTGPIAKYIFVSKDFTGWARILSLGNTGWINFGTTTPLASYQVKVKSNGEFDGYAWNGNDIASTGIGWIKFNNQTGPASPIDYRSFTNYEVSLSAPFPPTNVQVLATTSMAVSDPCRILTITWDDVFSEDGYDVYGTTTNPFTPIDGDKYIPSLAPDITSKIVDRLPNGYSFVPGTVYYFIVSAFNSFGTAYSDIASGSTYPICQTALNSDLKGECPDTVHLIWTVPEKASTCTIKQYDISRCQCVNRACANCTGQPAFTLLATTTATSYDDQDFDETTNQPYKWYRYVVQTECTTGEIGKWTDPDSSDQVVPCASNPKWIEKKSQ
jgi:hypothetical protein